MAKKAVEARAELAFPRHMHKDGGLYVVVRDQAQYDACAAKGWADQPSAYADVPREVLLNDALGA